MTDETIFAVSLEKADPAARAAYLDAVCKDNPEQRKRIDGLLAAHDHAGAFLARPAIVPPEPETAPTRAYHTPEAEVNDGATRTQGEVADEDVDDALAFLQPATRPDSLGRIGHYEVLEVLGKGGFGIVFRAFDEELQRVVAVKVLAPSMAATSPARKRFIREAQSAARVKHENVVQIYKVSRDDERLPYLEMEFVSGETLQARLDRKGPLEVPEVVRIGRQLAEGLAAAHGQGLIHRDIKPSNILIDRGPQDRAKITDFGLARAADDASLTRSGVVAGTPMYMAPEQAKGETLDHRADLFSLGSVMYAMLTGRPPFRAETTLAVLKRVAEDTPRPMREVIPEVPEWLCRVVEKLHAKNPAERYQTAREVADVLADCEKQLQAHAAVKDLSRIPEAKRPEVTSRRLPAALLLFCGVVVVAGVIGVQQRALGKSEFVLLIVGLLALLIPAWLRARRDPVAEGMSPAPPQRRGQWKWAAAALVLCGVVAALWLGLAALKYYSDRAEVEFQPHPNVLEIAVVSQGFPSERKVVPAEGGVMKLPPGDYRVEARCKPGHEVDRWEITAHLGHDGTSTERLPPHRGENFVLHVNHGERFTIRPVVDDQAAAERRARDAIDPNKLKELGKAVNEFKSQQEGFVPLFNGQDLTGWKHLKHNVEGHDPTRAFEVQGDVLVAKGTPYGFLQSNVDLNRPFQLRYQWRGTANESPATAHRLYFHEYQTADPFPKGVKVSVSTEEASVILSTNTGEARTVKPVRPVNEWQDVVVVYNNNSISVTVNGVQTVEARCDRFVPSRLVLESVNSNEFHFRKIEIKELPSSVPAPTTADRVEMAKFKGEWQVQLAVLNDKPLPQKDIDQLLIRFAGEQFEFQQSIFTNVKETGTFRVDAANKQLFLNFKYSPVPVRCSYRLDGDRLRLAFESWDGKTRVDAADLLQLHDSYRTINSLRELALAMHSYNDELGGLPRAALTNPKAKDGKPLLSWRVAILPYIQQQELYKQFKLDEPWDSENNRKLIAKMPTVFETPAVSTAGPGMTHYRVFTGPGTAFEALPNRDFGVQLTEIRDGSANTLLIVEAADPVIWTKPDELPYDPEKPLPKLGATKVGIPVAMCDGSTGTLAPDVSEKTLRALVTRSGGEIASVPLLKPDPLQTPPMYLECVRLQPKPPAPDPAVLQPPRDAVAPFDETKAKSLQDSWAKHLGVPVEYTNPVGMKLRLIPPGEFTMGSNLKEVEAVVNTQELRARPWARDWVRAEGPPRRVKVAEPFFLGVHEVTAGQFRQFAAAKKYKTFAEKDGGGTAWNPESQAWKVAPSHVWNNAEFVGSDSHPVGFMTLADAKAFCAWLGEQDGLRYAVPTEEQWEFACRAGTTTPWSFGDDAAAMEQHGWTTPHADGEHHPVGRLAANPFGLFDMYGNAREITLGAKEESVDRGGEAGRSALWARSAARMPINNPDGAFQRRGFRVAVVGQLKPKPAKQPDPAVIQPLKDAVAAHTRTLDAVKTRYDVGTVSKIELRAAEADLSEARIKLAEAEGDKAAVLARLEDLVKQRQEERDLIELRFKVGADPATVLNQADARLADAKARLAKVKPQAKPVEPPPPPAGGPERAPEPRPVPKLLRKFDPEKDVTIAYGLRDKSGWTFKVPSEERTLRLFELTNPEVDAGGVLVFRVKMSAVRVIRAYPEIVCRFPDGTQTRSAVPKVIAEGITNPAAYEIRCPLKPGTKPDLVRLNLVVQGQGGEAVSDAYLPWMELWQLPIEQLHGRVAAPTTLPRKFDPAREWSVTFGGPKDASGWFFEVKPNQETICLFEVENPATDEAATLVLRGRLSTTRVKGAYLQIVCCFPDGTDAVSKEPEIIAEGDTNLARYEARHPLKKGEKPYLVRVNLVLKKSDRQQQSVFLTELELSQTPAGDSKK